MFESSLSVGHHGGNGSLVYSLEGDDWMSTATSEYVGAISCSVQRMALRDLDNHLDIRDKSSDSDASIVDSRHQEAEVRTPSSIVHY